jgi:hypothetical protein
MRQLINPYTGAVFDPGWEANDPDDESSWQTERLGMYLKERPRGVGYVADFEFTSKDLPVLPNRDHQPLSAQIRHAVRSPCPGRRRGPRQGGTGSRTGSPRRASKIAFAPGPTSDQLSESRELKRRNRLLDQENEVLRRAAAYLSQAQLPGKGSTRS